MKTAVILFLRALISIDSGGAYGGREVTGTYTYVADKNDNGKFVSCFPHWDDIDLDIFDSYQLTIYCKCIKLSHVRNILNINEASIETISTFKIWTLSYSLLHIHIFIKCRYIATFTLLSL